jgi:hypothetical protein
MFVLNGCFAHEPTHFYYTKAPEYDGIPLKTIQIYEDKNFGNADLVSLDSAVGQWNYALNGYIRLVVVSTTFDMQPEILDSVVNHNSGWLILKTDSYSEVAKNKLTVGTSNSVGGNVIHIIRDRITNEDLEIIMLHEIGHLLGSGHNTSYLMAKHFDRDHMQCIDYFTLSNVASFQHIQLNRLNYCVYGDRKN